MFNFFKRKARGPEIWRHESFDAMCLAAAAFIRENAKMLRQRNGRYTLGLGGGALFRGVFERLAHGPVHSALDWSAVHVFWCEEFILAPEDGRSNYRSARERLIDRTSLPSANVHRMLSANAATPQATAESWAQAYEGEVAQFFGARPGGSPPVFDCLLLAHARFDDAPGRWFAPRGAPARLDNEEVPVIAMSASVVNAASNVLICVVDPKGAGPQDSSLQPSGRCIWLYPTR